MNKAVRFTESSFKEFKKLYEACEDGGVFKFEGHDILKMYAKYVIQHVEMNQKKGVK